MRTEIPEEQLFVAHPSSSGRDFLFSHCTQGSAEANAKTLLRGFIAVAPKKEIKHLYFCSVQHKQREAKQQISETYRFNDTRIFSNIMLFLNVNDVFMVRNC